MFPSFYYTPDHPSIRHPCFRTVAQAGNHLCILEQRHPYKSGMQPTSPQKSILLHFSKHSSAQLPSVPARPNLPHPERTNFSKPALDLFQKSPLPAPKTETVFLRPSTDILYLPYRLFQQSVSPCLDIPDLLSREANQKITRLAISIPDFQRIVNAELHPKRLPEWLRSPVQQVVFGLRNLEVLYVIGGDELARLWLPWNPRLRAKREKREDKGSNVVVGQWTGEEDVELVGLGEGTFQKRGGGYGGMRGEADGSPHPPPETIEGVEELWSSVVESIQKKKGISVWNVPNEPATVGLCVQAPFQASPTLNFKNYHNTSYYPSCRL